MFFDKNGATTPQESDDFTVEESALLFEMCILESCTSEEIQSFLSDPKAVNEAIRQEIITEKTVVRLDKGAKISKAVKMAEFEIAKKKKDKDFRKLLTIWKMEREIEARLHKKYGQMAKTVGRKNFADSLRTKKTSVSSVIQKATNTAKKQFNPEVKTQPTNRPVKPLPIGNVPLAKLN